MGQANAMQSCFCFFFLTKINKLDLSPWSVRGRRATGPPCLTAAPASDLLWHGEGKDARTAPLCPWTRGKRSGWGRRGRTGRPVTCCGTPSRVGRTWPRAQPGTLREHPRMVTTRPHPPPRCPPPHKGPLASPASRGALVASPGSASKTQLPLVLVTGRPC